VTFAAVLLAPSLSVPAAAALALWLLWYWRRLGRELVPESRRRVRRAATAVMLAGIVCLVPALSFLDPEAMPGAWALAWVMVMILLAIMMAAAAIDVFNTLRLARQERVDRAIQEAVERARMRRGQAG
jgi:peptidoglycan/LPS O-acetylase OafA/YrhL